LVIVVVAFLVATSRSSSVSATCPQLCLFLAPMSPHRSSLSMGKLLVITMALGVMVMTIAVDAKNVVPNTPGFSLGSIDSYTLMASSNASSLYSVNLAAPATNDYQYPIYLIDLKGSRYQMGYDCTVSPLSLSVWNFHGFYRICELCNTHCESTTIVVVVVVVVDMTRWSTVGQASSGGVQHGSAKDHSGLSGFGVPIAQERVRGVHGLAMALPFATSAFAIHTRDCRYSRWIASSQGARC
jgi:hypothetical protein